MNRSPKSSDLVFHVLIIDGIKMIDDTLDGSRGKTTLEHGQRPNVLSAGADVGAFFHNGLMDAPFHDLFAVLVKMN